MNAEDVNAIIAEVGPLDDDISRVVRVDEQTWIIEFSEALTQLDFNAENGRLTVVSPVGIPHPERRSEVMSALLMYSMLWRETGGIRMGMSGPDGMAYQIVDLAADRITAKTIVTVCANIANRSLGWQTFVEAGASDEPSVPFAFDPAMIRV